MVGLATGLLVFGWLLFLLRPTGRSPALVYVAAAFLLLDVGLDAAARMVTDVDWMLTTRTVLALLHVAETIVAGVAVLLATTPPRGAYPYAAPFTPPGAPR